MSVYAQTNIQLFNQIRNAGYGDGEAALLGRAYELAMRLFTGCFRPSGKPFLAHAVGTASILVIVRAPAATAAAGLLHAAYTHGEFGLGDRSLSEAKREYVRRLVGPDVEELIARYTAFRWTKKTIPVIRERLDELNPTERTVLLIRLANELEDHLDLGILYCVDAERRLQNISSRLHVSIEMAAGLGFPTLATALEGVFRDVVATQVPVELRGQHSSSFVLAPASHRPRLGVNLRRIADGLAQWRPFASQDGRSSQKDGG